MKIEASDMPISAAKTQNVVWAAEADILLMRAERKNTKPSGARNTTHISGVPKIACCSAGLVETKNATAPDSARATHM